MEWPARGIMETRVFDYTDTVLSADGQHSQTFGRGERVKNIKLIGLRVLFEPLDPYHVARTYVMDWHEFEQITTAVREARA
jgi:hypothetical protein